MSARPILAAEKRADQIGYFAPERMPTPEAMSRAEMISLIKEAIPFVHGHGLDRMVEALSGALDRLEWSNLVSAPRDGTTVMIAFGSRLDRPGYAALARWHIPCAGDPLTPAQFRRLERRGGWWTSGRDLKPHRAAALAWLPAPELPFATPAIDPDAVTGCADDLGLYAQDEAA